MRYRDLVEGWLWWATFRLAVASGVGIRRAASFARDACSEIEE